MFNNKYIALVTVCLLLGLVSCGGAGQDDNKLPAGVDCVADTDICVANVQKGS